ncbi:sensor histidine kinase [Neobacillus niacini]|uniref:sensor histidine kinase n=1 Tax=Neobacillus niacini TaxID=86668 RepID=UPI0021CB2D76|nr:sensor histidine kinase [Neobacillus niacini]MCM3764165.1 sensor histidine kinase [Neobacillus niacini]
MMAVKLKNLFRRYFFYSFKSTINSLFLPIIIIFIFISGWISSALATSQIEENAYKNVNDTIFQTKNYLDYMLLDVFQQFVSLANDPKVKYMLALDDSEIKPETRIEVDRNVQMIYTRYNTILDSVIIDYEQKGHSFYRTPYISYPTINYDDYFNRYEGNTEGYYWENLHNDESLNQNDKVISVFRLMKSEKSRGIVLFNLRTDFFEEVVNKSLIGKNGYLTLVSPDGSYESKTVKKEYRLDQETLHSLQQLDREKGEFTYKSLSGENMIVIYDTIKTNKWKLAAVVPESEILTKVNYIKHFNILLILLLAVCTVVLTNIMSKFITNPFKKMAYQMAGFNQKDLDMNYELSGPEEMKILHNGFKELIARINTLMEQVQMEQEAKRQLEFAIMHAQINPHFLYNTLYSIKGLCDMGLNKDASQMISALSSFFRISISKGQEIISIREELEHIEHYLYIQEMRYGDDFVYEIDVEEDILSNNIIKLSLQPLIENAIYHGVKQKRGKGKITIRGDQADDLIYLEVADDGNGIEKEKLQEIMREMDSAYRDKKASIGIGIKSVNERIKIHFGQEYGLTISSEPGFGTTVGIKIPKTKGESVKDA